jgi:hypothetical protein
MLAGTAVIATATDLSDYPAPFVKNGLFDGKIVIGTQGSGAGIASDMLGAIDIAASLQRAATSKIASTAATTTVAGGTRLDTSSDRIYLKQGFGIDSVTKDNLDLLADKQFDDSEGTTYDYTQSIVFNKVTPQNLTFGQHDESDMDSFLAFDLDTSTSASSYMYVTKVDFSKTVNATSTNVIGQKITLFGNEYTFSSESTGSKLVLYGSAEEVSLTPKDDVTKTIGGKSFEVKVIGFTSTGSKVTLSVNGVADSIAEGASKTINGLKIYAKSVSSWNNGIDGLATVQLGAQKVVLEDGQELAVGTSEDSVKGTLVDLGGTTSALTSIYVYSDAKDSSAPDIYLKQGGEYVDPTYGTFKITFPNVNYPLTDASRDLIQVQPSGSTRVYAKVTPAGGTEKTVYFDYNNALQWDSTRAIYSEEGAPAAENNYIYLTPNSATDAKYTHLVRIKNIRTDASNGYVEFEDALTGAVYKTTETAFATQGANTTVTVDGKSYDVSLVVATAGSEQINAKYSTDEVVYPAMELKNGEWFALVNNVTFAPPLSLGGTILLPTGTATLPATNASATALIHGNLDTGNMVNFTVAVNQVTSKVTGIYLTQNPVPTVLLKEEKDFNNAENFVVIPTLYSSVGVDVGTPLFRGTGTGYVAVSGQPMQDDKTTGYVDFFGTYATKYAPSSDNSVVVKVYYPNEQMYANAFIAPLASTASSSGTSGAVSLNPISVGMAITDKDATALGTKAYIVMGGPCANTVAFDLMNKPADCAAGFTEGKAKIKFFAAQNALLVAGFSASDSQGAARVLANYADYKLTGSEVEVVTTNLASLTVNKVQ